MFGMGWIFDTYEYTGARPHSYEAWLQNQR